MIGYIRGKVTALFKDACFLEAGGIGYRIFISDKTRQRLSNGQEAKLLTYMAVREDAILLYGFLGQEEYDLFLVLLSVSKIGPKVAMGILSSMDPAQFVGAVKAQNVSRLTKLPGIGKKTAERLLVELKDKINTAIILITHDLGVVAGIADRVAVMYAGKVVETGTTAQIFYEHKHPYTEALLRSLPSAEAGKREPLMSIPGTPPDLLCPPKGCGFAARCRHCMQICREEQPPEFELGDGHKASCWLLHPDCPCAAERGDDQ